MIEIDGSEGEGGGQMLRTSLALSLVTGQPFRMKRIRAGRQRPGLMRQHLTGVEAAAAVGNARVTGAALGSKELSFHPGRVAAATDYRFAVGTAGSAVLVLQTVLPALLLADGSISLTVEGGTHNPTAPPFDFFQQTFLPIVNRMGPNVQATLLRHGFYPAGGGKISVTVTPAKRLTPLNLLERGPIRQQRATALVARLPRHIAERELQVVARDLNWDADCLEVREIADSQGPGNALLVCIAGRDVTEVFAGFGERGVKAEEVAAGAVREVQEYLTSGAPVGRHLADQLLIPLALAGGGTFRTLPPTDHTTTNGHVIRKFLDVQVVASLEESSGPERAWRIEIR